MTWKVFLAALAALIFVGCGEGGATTSSSATDVVPEVIESEEIVQPIEEVVVNSPEMLPPVPMIPE